MSHYSVTYHNDRAQDLMIICNMVYLIIVPTFALTMIFEESTTVMQMILLTTGSVLNLIASALVFYHWHTAKAEFEIASNSIIILGLAMLCNGIVMGVDVVMNWLKIREQNEELN